MKAIKCDRCGKMQTAKSRMYGITAYYIGNVKEYMYSDEPRIDDVDLCMSCQLELDAFVSEFMKNKHND
jgi:hypothetical protein